MTTILESLKMELLLQYRSKWIYLVFVSALAFFGYTAQQYIASYEPGLAVSSTAQIVQAGIFFFLFYGVYLSREEVTSDADEVFYTIQNGFRSKVIAKLLLLVFVNLSFFICSYTLLAIFYYTDRVPFPFLTDAFFYLLLYWTLPFLIAGMIGLTFGLIIQTKAVYPILLLLGILIGPLNRLTYIALTKTLPLWLEQVMFMLNLGQSDPFRVYHIVYGFPMETYRWITKGSLFLIALCCLITILFIKMNQKRKMPTIFALFTVSTILFTFSWMTFSPFTGQLTSKQAIGSDYDYYRSNAKLHQPFNSSQSFKVTQYTINVEVGHKLHSIVDVSLIPSGTTQELAFNLYHGFRVQKVRMENRNLEFEQKGDQFFVHVKQPIMPTNTYQLTIEYEGAPTQRFFANQDAVMLPSFFTWYPKPSVQPVAEFHHIEALFFDVIAKEKIDYVLNYTGPHPLFTNLQSRSNGHWTGSTKTGITLVSGRMEKLSIEDFEVIRPYALYNVSSNLALDLKKINELNTEIQSWLHDNAAPIEKFFFIETRLANSSIWHTADHTIIDLGLFANHDNALKLENESLIKNLIEANVRTYRFEQQEKLMKDLYLYALTYKFSQEQGLTPRDRTLLVHYLADNIRNYEPTHVQTYEELVRFLEQNRQNNRLLKEFFYEWLNTLNSTENVNWDHVQHLLDSNKER